MSLKNVFVFAVACFAIASCDSGSSSGSSGGSPTGPTTSPSGTTETNFVGRWTIKAIPADTVVFSPDGKGKLIVDLGFRVAVDSFQWSASSGNIHLAYSSEKTEDGTYRFFGKDSFNMTLPSLSTQLYLRVK